MRMWIGLILVVLLGTVSAEAQIGPGPFAAFPSQSAVDGRFLGFGCAGLATFEQGVTIGLEAPADSTTFAINFFDGETGQGANPHWDVGNRQLIYRLYADPLRQGSTDPANLIGSWTGNDPNPLSGPLWTASAATMPDNDWWAVTVTTSASAQAPSGNFFYNLVMGTDGTCDLLESLESNVKVASSAPLTFLVPSFGVVAALRQFTADGPIIYPGTFPPPGFDFVHAPTTYDGTFDFFIHLPGGETDLRLYDGDFDFGIGGLVGLPSGAVLSPCADLDDPDTPLLYGGFPFSTAGAAPELALSPGSPADDSTFDVFRRGELDSPDRVGCVRYEVIDPNGTVYRNDNPSGSQEWEQFRIATPLAVNPGDADHIATTDTLPAGVWRVHSVGLDLSNLNFWFADACATRVTPSGIEPACPTPGIYLVGDTVWFDLNGNGIQDAGEAGIPGITLELLGDLGGDPIQTVVTGDSTNPNWAACVLNNTGLDTQGLYCFGVDDPGSYIVRVAASNFQPGGALFGYASTTGGTTQTRSVVNDNVLTYDFGYRGDASIGDRVWIDANGDGTQDTGELGLDGITVELLDGGGNVLATAVTDTDGLYLFDNLTAGTYGVRVAVSTLPAGLVQTYDLDGTGTAHTASVGLAPGQDRTDVDFGYRGTASLGDRVWNDLDADGVQDGGEAGLNGITVELLDSAGNIVATTTTSGDGGYSFQYLRPGTYTVRVVSSTLPADYAQTYDLDGTSSQHQATVSLGAGEARADLDFGYRNPPTASIGDRVWNDLDGDGVQEAGEDGLNGVTVQLLNGSGTVIATQVTSGNGNYTFTSLVAGTYSVRVVTGTLPAGFIQSYDLDGTGTAHTATVSLAVGDARTDVDFGYRANPALQPGTGTIGYWKTHPEAWPVQQITIAGKTYTKAQAISWMDMSSRGDKTIDLFKQLVASKLNVIIGNDASCVSSSISAANSWLAANPLGSNVRSNSAAWVTGGPLHQRLDDYNNGELCAPHRG